MKTLSVVSLLSLAYQGLAQFVPYPTDLLEKEGYAGIPVRYKEVPTGICELDPNVKSYSGYLDVGYDQHLFFWFFEARQVDPTTAPLTVWINGGPGSSSMYGVFTENGPCRLDKNYNVHSNDYSWNNVSNMLYIEEPVTVGLSYSVPVPGYQDLSGVYGDITVLPNNTCPDWPSISSCGTFSAPNQTLTANSTQNAAPNMWKGLQGFMGVFPQYARGGFHFATESYGGHYGPVFNEYFEQQNALNIPGAHKISLQSVAIGNGWYNPLVQYAAYYNFTVYPGNTYDFFPFDAKLEEQMYNAMYGPGNCHDRVSYCQKNKQDDVCSVTDVFCADQVEELLDNYANRDEDDIRELAPDPFPPLYFVDYLNTPEVRSAIGAYVNYSDYSYITGDGFYVTGDDSREVMTVQDVRKLLSQGVTVMMYHGDADYNCNWLGGHVISHRIGGAAFEKAGYANISTSDGIVHGVVKQAGKFSFARIYESGHMVPFYQPLLALSIFSRAIAGLDIETGTKPTPSSYLTVGPKTSTYREGNSTVQFHVTPPSKHYSTKLNGPVTPHHQPPEVEAEVARLRKRYQGKGRAMKMALKRKIRHLQARAFYDAME